jgi:hypothetical protein
MADDADLEAELDEWISGEPETFPETTQAEEDEYWNPTADEGVERILRRRARMESEVARIEKFAAGEIGKIRSFADDRAGGPKGWIARADIALEQFARKVHGARSDGRLWRLPSGSLRLTAGQDSLVLDDEQAAVKFCAREGLPCVSLSVSRAELKKLVEAVPYPADELTCSCKQREGSLLLPSARYATRVDPECPIHGDFEWLRAVTADGEVVPGVHVSRRRKPTFTAKSS